MPKRCSRKQKFIMFGVLLAETPDLPVVPQKEWIHMDKIEYDKLEWMKELPPPVTGDHKVYIFNCVLLSSLPNLKMFIFLLWLVYILIPLFKEFNWILTEL